ncbi:hypothetical protein ABIE26_001448 [Pedobacter africanus]|uniref:Uncharacterized protein n=1 Tax=Pedobacter africanus TaxID=151894 RepID=A0ACC6KSE0_9SPHI|nr:DUF4374 domain-containing protein [Pedobacter africanus]MDR6782063.1 hypothetical protein [Pedobacter africanus]
MSLKFKYTPYLFLLFLTACTRGPIQTQNPDTNKFSIYILAKDGKEYILETNTLEKGELQPETNGADVSSASMSREAIVKDGCYYHLDRKNARLVKYQIQNRQLHETGSLPLKDFSIENFYWKTRDTLLLTGLSVPDFSKIKYALLNTDKMQQTAVGDMDIARPSGRFNNTSVGFVELRRNRLFVGYTYHQQLSATNYTTSDTTYVTELNFPLMTGVKTDKDIRSTYPGGINTVQSYSFNDKQGNYYFMTCPGIALGNRPELPTGIMRINAGDDQPDPAYFLNLSQSIHNHAYGMWYLGNDQVIVRAERKDLYKGLGDHYSTAHFEFYLVNLTNGTAKKLDLPLDKGTRRECVIVNNDIAYIAVNSSAEGNFIWIYNIKTGTLKKGLKLSGNTDFIMRIDHLQA